MSSKKEYVYCIWAHSKVNGPSPYIYRMVATSKADVKRKWAESFYWQLTIDHIEKADITPEYLNRPYDFDDDNDDRLIGQYITVDPNESPRRTELRDYDKMLVEMYEGSIKSTFDNPKRTALETAEAFHYGELIDEIYESCDINHVIEQMESAMNGIGRFYSYWEGNEWTALYFYGVSFVEMKQKIEPFIASYSLCQKSRIEQIA